MGDRRHPGARSVFSPQDCVVEYTDFEACPTKSHTHADGMHDVLSDSKCGAILIDAHLHCR